MLESGPFPALANGDDGQNQKANAGEEDEKVEENSPVVHCLIADDGLGDDARQYQVDGKQHKAYVKAHTSFFFLAFTLRGGKLDFMMHDEGRIHAHQCKNQVIKPQSQEPACILKKGRDDTKQREQEADSGGNIQAGICPHFGYGQDFGKLWMLDGKTIYER